MIANLRVISVATCAECPFHVERPFACVCAWGEEEADVRIVEDRDNQPEWCPLEKTEVLVTTRIPHIIKDLDQNNAVQISGSQAKSSTPEAVQSEHGDYLPGESEATQLLRDTLCKIAAAGVKTGPIALHYNDETIECSDVFDLVNHLIQMAEIEWCSYSPRDDGEWVFDMPDWCDVLAILLDELPMVKNYFKEINWDIQNVIDLGCTCSEEESHDKE